MTTKKIKKRSKKVSKKPKESKTVIHIKLEYEEAKTAKMDLLSSEANLLKLLQDLQNYKKLRTQELNKKMAIAKKIRETKNAIRKLKALLPKYKVPDILKKEEKEEEKPKKEKEEKIVPKKPVFKSSLESQLEEIQRKLKALQQKA